MCNHSSIRRLAGRQNIVYDALIRRFISLSFRLLGRTFYWLLLPVIRPLVSRTSRAYILLRAGNDVLVVKGWLGNQEWQLPGGGIQRNEKPEAAARRETLEEVGIKLKPSQLELVTNSKWHSNGMHHEYYIYLVRVPEHLPIIHSHPFEIIESAWLPASTFNAENMSPEILEVIKKTTQR